MNVLPYAFTSQLNIKLYSLAEIRFSGMSIKYADNRKTLLHHWVYLDVRIEDIQKRIRLVIISNIPEVSHSERLNLLLGIPWLFAVNVVISIRNSKIKVGDPTINEESKAIIRTELVFCKDHNFLMNPKAILTPASKLIKEADESDKDSNNSDNLSKVDEDKGFQKIPDTILNYLILLLYVSQ